MTITEAPPSQTPEANTRKSPTTIVAVVAALAIGAGGGWVVARSAAPATTEAPGTTTTSEGGTVANTVVSSFAVGERRGFESVHQGGAADIGNVLVSTDWLADQIAGGGWRRTTSCSST